MTAEMREGNFNKTQKLLIFMINDEIKLFLTVSQADDTITVLCNDPT